MDESKHILKHMGSKIRNLRMGRGWKLGELSEKSGISMAMLSKIENGRVYPTFPTLLRVLKTLEVDLNAFFEDMSMNNDFPGYIFHKREDYTEITKEDSIGFRYENILTQSLSGISLEVSLLTLSQDAERELLTTDGFEYIFLVKGDINYVLDNKTFHLREGDSLYFDGRLPHVPKNNLESEAILLVIYFITEL